MKASIFYALLTALLLASLGLTGCGHPAPGQAKFIGQVHR